MSLKEQLMADLKTAMKEKDKIKKDTITLVRAAIKQKEVDERTEVSDDEIMVILSKQMKERKASLEEFEKADRQDLIEKTQAEMEVLLHYLPKQLSEEELRRIIEETAQENNISEKKDMGTLMKTVMPKVKGRVDGKLVSKIASTILK